MFNKKILQITIFIVSIVIFKKKNNKNNRLRPDDTADNTLTILMVLSVQVRISGARQDSTSCLMLLPQKPFYPISSPKTRRRFNSSFSLNIGGLCPLFFGPSPTISYHAGKVRRSRPFGQASLALSAALVLVVLLGVFFGASLPYFVISLRKKF